MKTVNGVACWLQRAFPNGPNGTVITIRHPDVVNRLYMQVQVLEKDYDDRHLEKKTT